MKVCTDACILGAYVEVQNTKTILDIGTGTGLLALMLAQRSQAVIDAVEIDQDAYLQAVGNISASKFQSRINIYNQPIQNFKSNSPISSNNKKAPTFDIPKIDNKKAPKFDIQHSKIDIPKIDIPQYGLIISNPPFYQNSLQSPDKQTNKALHATTLTFDELIDNVIRLLQPDGRFVVLLPPFETEQLQAIAQKKALSLSKKLLIKHNSQKPVFRIISTFERNPIYEYQEDTLIIHENDSKSYSDKFQNLLRDYYIIF